MDYKKMDKERLIEEKESVFRKINEFKALGIKLNMSRGIPNPRVIDITAKKFSGIDVYTSRIHKDNADLGTYNQSLLAGIREAREFFAEILDVGIENIIIGGNSSLNLMFDMFSQLMLHGNFESERPWCREDRVKFLCPVPGYDRHFAICEYMGIDMISVPMTEQGPDMDAVESLACSDSSIKGIWCVPMYSNPDGCIYSENTVRRLAAMKTAAADFRIFWDNAYSMHHLFENEEKCVLNILEECMKAGNPSRPYIFSSTSKISMPGSGISAIAASTDNVRDILSRMKYQTIGYDKMNMIRHTIAFPDRASVSRHMKKIADILRPNFEVTISTLERELGGLGIAGWSCPSGGYFISFNAMEGCASRIIGLCAEAGVVLTPAGSTFPYGVDPLDSNIRIAPTYPSYDEMKMAAEIFCACVKYAVLEKMTAGGRDD
ncbi:MAG: aminotransferase class I/II-fold pyridoxal phosphate-dependent enzyme [Clostridia bacterium]|nr:aminotransferase class I/II-fold pyridoxal phosphate-dependent enzyme [Clostridia bacterium]